MSNGSSLDKDRLYFTQCSDIIYLRCPVCTEEKKVLRHCKLFKNFQSIWCHIRREHKDIPPGKLEEIIQILTGLFKAFQHQMFPKWAYSEAKSENESEDTATSSLLFNGKIPRKDVWERLQDIGRLLKGQSQFYPNFKRKQVLGLIKVILQNADERTKKKYFDCVTKYSVPDKIKGEYDVTQFCKEVGV